MNFTLMIGIWAAIACVVLALAAYRFVLSHNEDDSVHLNDREVGMIAKQLTVGHKLDVIDKWGRIATVVVVVLGVALAGVYLMAAWQAANKLP